jgi:YHS domain-containing protein
VTRAILLFLLMIFVARAVWRLLEGVVSGASPPQARGRTAPQPVKLVKDPVCGTFVVPGKSPSLVRAGETIYFCSDTCREQFAAKA